MPVFRHTFTVSASLAAVAAFHHSARVLKQLSPPPLIVQLHRVEPLAEGSLADFTLWFGPFPIRWQAVHTHVTAHGFTDTQTRGPMQHWRHTHRFQSLTDATTQVSDEIDYAHHPGWRGMVTQLLFNPLALRVLFAYRGWVTCLAVNPIPGPSPKEQHFWGGE